MNRRRAFALIVLLALAMFARPLVRREVLNFRDHGDYFQPLRHFTAQELRHFRLPLWNPYSASGEPWLANPQTGVFYPPAWLFVVLPFATAYPLFLLLHIVLLGCGAFLLFSRFASARAAFLGSVILMFCGPTLSLLDISNNLTAFAWIPLVLWCALADVSPAWSGAFIAMSFLAGEPFLAAVGALLFALLRRKQIVDVALTAIFLAGVQLAPFVAAVLGSDRAGSVAREEILRDSVPLADWLRLALPMPGAHQQFIPVMYLGLVTAMLAVIGMATAIHVRAARAWLALLVISMVISTGSYFPFIAELLIKLPLTVLRYPARLIPLGALAVIALAVIGWDRVTKWVPYPWLTIVVVALVIADLVPRIAPLLASQPFRLNVVPYARTIGRDGKIIRLTGARSQQPHFDRQAWISGYLNLFERRFDSWTAAPLVSRSYTRAYQSALTRRDELDAMSMQYVLANQRIPALPAIAGAREVIVHRNPAAMPMAYWRDLTGRMVPAATLVFTTQAVHVVVDAPREGMVVVTQQDAPGWEVEVDGRRATPQRAGVFRAVHVGSGHHAITWRYRPRSFMIGSALTIAAFARMLLSTPFVKRKWHKKNFFREAKFT